MQRNTGQPPLGDTAAYGRLLVFAEEHGITVTNKHSVRLANGLTTLGQSDGRGNVWVASDSTPETRTCVLAHELTHAALQVGGMPEAHSETEAYCVGFAVCEMLGYSKEAEEQLAQIRRFRGRVSVDALTFAKQLSSIVTL